VRKVETTQLKISNVTTNSIEAYNYFLRGKDNYERYYWERAQQFLENAIELDSTFAMAYFYLGRTFERIGDGKARNEAYVNAKTFSGQTTEKERLYIEAAYANAIEGNREKRFRILKQMAQKYPKEKHIHNQLGHYYYHSGFFHEAIEEYNKALELDPHWGLAINLCAWAYADMDNFDKAVEYLEKYVLVSPDDANPLDSMAEIYFRMGKLDDAITKYMEALEVNADFYHAMWSTGYIYALEENYKEAMKWPDKFIGRAQSPGRRAEGYVWKGFYHYWLGSLDKSLSDLRKAENIAEGAGNVLWKAYADWMRGWIYYDRGEIELSRRYFKSWFDNYVEIGPFFFPVYKAEYSFYTGLVDLRQGRINSAKSKLDEMKSHLSEIAVSSKYWLTLIKGFYDILAGEILLAEDSVEKAIVICEKTSPLGMPSPDDNSKYRLDYNAPFLKDVLARAYQKKREIDKAIDEYVRLITFDPNRKERFLIHPKYHYRLAKLYEEKGWEGKAIEHYEKFLTLWKEADPDIPEVEDAKKKLERLKSR
jgi:tetratricopeptide (TPR) repeat protein